MKNSTILVIALLVSQVSFAQDEFRIGLKSGLNLGWLSGTSKAIDNDGITAAFSYGVMADYYFRDNYGLSAEILLSTVKSNFTLNEPQVFTKLAPVDTVQSLNYEYTVQYLELPVSMKFRTNEIGNMTYWGNFGFSPGFALNSRTTIGGALPQAVKDEDPTDFKVNDDDGTIFTVNDFDDKVFLFRFPLIIGGGVEYKMAGKTSLQGGIRYSNSFTDLFLKDKSADARNNYFAISLGILF